MSVIVFIPLANRKGVAKIDIEDYPKVSHLKWYLSSGYATTTTKGQRRHTVRMHQLISPAPRGAYIDHANRDKLDNRRRNLRHCSRSQNSANSKIARTNTSGYRGVCWNKRKRMWQTSVRQGRTLVRRLFSSPEDAARFYNETVKSLFGEFAHVNEIPPPRQLPFPFARLCTCLACLPVVAVTRRED